MTETCAVCGEPIAVGQFPCITTARPHRFLDRGFAVIGDEIVGGFVQEHFGPTPEVFHSKQAMARRAKELGLVERVRHVGTPGSDKSSKTQRWL